MSSQAQANKAIVREITEQIWNQARVDRIPDFYSSDYVADYRPYGPLRTGHEGIRGMIERAHAAFSSFHEALHELIAEGNLVVAHFTISGIQSGQWGVLPPTHKRVEFDEIVILELRDGLVIKQRGIPDNLAALRQLGVIPSPPSSS